MTIINQLMELRLMIILAGYAAIIQETHAMYYAQSILEQVVEDYKKAQKEMSAAKVVRLTNWILDVDVGKNDVHRATLLLRKMTHQ